MNKRIEKLHMYKEPSAFSLDEFVRQNGGSELELHLLKAYFELDPDVRQKIIEKVICAQIDDLPQVPDRAET